MSSVIINKDVYTSEDITTKTASVCSDFHILAIHQGQLSLTSLQGR